MSKVPDLNMLDAFVAVARHKNFRKAGEERGVSASAISHTIRGLEEQLNVRLLNRTTRSVTPTRAGEELLNQILPAMTKIYDAVNELESNSGKPGGTLRLNMPHSAAQFVVAPVLSAYHRLCPDVKLEIVSDDRFTDIVSEGFDAGIRYGESLSPDMIAIAVGKPQHFVVVASPQYIEIHGIPSTPEDLFSHRCVGRIFPSGKHYNWEFVRNRKLFTITVTKEVAISNQNIIRQLVLEGNGIAYLNRETVTQELQSGKLIQLLIEWMPEPDQFYLYYYGRRQLSPALRKFIDIVKS